MRCGERWTAMEFAGVCEAVAAELRSRAASRAIAPAERLPLFQWLTVVKDVVVRLDAVHEVPGLAKVRSEKRSPVAVCKGDFLACLRGDQGFDTEKKLHFLSGSAELRDNEQNHPTNPIEKSPAAVER